MRVNIQSSLSDGQRAFVLSLLMILISEIGDKTFIVACLMAMRHSRSVVFAGAFSSLAIMSLLSALMGHTLMRLMSRRTTNYLAGILFLVFGVRMLMEGLASEQHGVQEEMEEVELEISAVEHAEEAEAHDLEHGPAPGEDAWRPAASLKSQAVHAAASLAIGLRNLASFVLSPVFIQAFVLTFLAEWGDRSQIATIALAAGADFRWVTLGTTVGHAICTAGAVVGGRLVASKISVRTVTLCGAVLFLAFGLLGLYEAWTYSDETL